MDKQWFYTQGRSEQQGPVSEEEIRELIKQRVLRKRDMLWAEGMTDWLRVSQVPAFTLPPLSTTSGEPVLPPMASDLPASLPTWMGFVGVISIVFGILTCLSCVGLPAGIAAIIGGSALLAAKAALANVDEIPEGLGVFFKKLKVFFVAIGILCIFLVLALAAQVIFFLIVMVG